MCGEDGMYPDGADDRFAIILLMTSDDGSMSGTISNVINDDGEAVHIRVNGIRSGNYFQGTWGLDAIEN